MSKLFARLGRGANNWVICAVGDDQRTMEGPPGELRSITALTVNVHESLKRNKKVYLEQSNFCIHLVRLVL